MGLVAALYLATALLLAILAYIIINRVQDQRSAADSTTTVSSFEPGFYATPV